MPRLTLATLGVRVKEKRGTRKLRGVAKDIDISPATLMRIENGRVPDIGTFGKVCKWLDIDPRLVSFPRQALSALPLFSVALGPAAAESWS